MTNVSFHIIPPLIIFTTKKTTSTFSTSANFSRVVFFQHPKFQNSPISKLPHISQKASNIAILPPKNNIGCSFFCSFFLRNICGVFVKLITLGFFSHYMYACKVAYIRCVFRLFLRKLRLFTKRCLFYTALCTSVLVAFYGYFVAFLCKKC